MDRPTRFAVAFLLSIGCVSTAGAQTPFAEGRIDIGLTVSDLERSIAFYEDVLGMQRAFSFEVDAPTARKVGLADIPFDAVAFKLTGDDDASVLKLVRSGNPAAGRIQGIEQRAGVRYLSLFVTELRPLLERLQENGVRVLGEGPLPLPDGRHIAVVSDPDGVLIELIGPLHEGEAQ